MPPLVSIVLPVYNAAATLDRCLASLRAQSIEDWELVAVDDGSTDESPAILKRAAGRDPRILFHAQSHTGVAGAANTARQAAKGAYVARMDADDEAHPQRLARQVAFLQGNAEIDFASCLVEFGGNAEAQAGFERHIAWTNSVRSAQEHALYQFLEYPLAHPTLCARRETWERAGPFEEGDFPEDYRWFLGAMERGLRFAKVPETLFTWHDPPTRLTRADPRYRVEAFFAAKIPFLTRSLRARLPESRPIVIWGAGRVTRQRVRPLLETDLPIAAWIDIDPRKIGGAANGLPVWGPDGIADRAERPFVLMAVRSIGARAQITQWLEANGFAAGADYLPLS